MSVHENEVFKSSPFVPKSTVLIGQSGATVLVGEDVDGVGIGGRIKLCSSVWTGKVSVLLVEIPFQELLDKVWAQMVGTVQVDSSVQTSL